MGQHNHNKEKTLQSQSLEDLSVTIDEIRDNLIEVRVHRHPEFFKQLVSEGLKIKEREGTRWIRIHARISVFPLKYRERLNITYDRDANTFWVRIHSAPLLYNQLIEMGLEISEQSGSKWVRFFGELTVFEYC